MKQESGRSGTVKAFNQEKGFGFIKQNGKGGDLFFHRTSLLDRTLEPYPGDKVDFDIIKAERGLNAINIKIHET